MSINPKVECIQKEFIEIYEAFKNNVDINIIYDSYENFSPNMHNFIKTKNVEWINAFFLMIDAMLKIGITRDCLRKKLLAMPNFNINAINYIIDSIYSKEKKINEINKANEIFNFYRESYYSPDELPKYTKMIKLYNNTVYDCQKKALIIKIHDNEKYNIIFYLDLEMKFNFNKFATELKKIIDKAYNVSQSF